MHDSEVDYSEEVPAFSREKNRACHQARIFSLHPASVFQHARKLTDRPYASTLVRAAKGGDDGVRGWQCDARGRGYGGGGKGGVFPHYKFNLTNGSENLETMEYMKCGRVYHAGGDAGWFRRQYCQGRSIFSESATARGPSRVEGGESGSRPGRASGKTCSWHDKKPRAEVDARFLSHSNRVAQMPV